MAEKITAIIVAAGSGTRMGGVINKVFLPLGERTVIDYTIEAFSNVEEISNIVLITRECDILESMEHIKTTAKRISIVKGGKSRQESVYLGLLQAADSDIVVIHDGARSLITPSIIKNAINDAKNFGASAVGVSAKDTIKIVDKDGYITQTLDRDYVINIQTPQVFYYDKILDCHQKAIKDSFLATDDCALYEKYEGKIKVTAGSYDNIKITTPDDLEVCEKILKKRNEGKV